MLWFTKNETAIDDTVTYGSTEWSRLLEQGWTTAAVDRQSGLATMVRKGR